MEVTVRMSDGRSVAVPINPDMTIRDVRIHLHRSTGVPLPSIHLLWGGLVLDDARTIGDCGLMSATMLHMVSQQLSVDVRDPELRAPSYFDWPINPDKVFVLCDRRSDDEEDTSFAHGEEEVGRVMVGKVRPQCFDCREEMMLLEGDGFNPRTMGELMAAIGRDSPLRVAECFNPNCSGATRKVWVDLKCSGDLRDGHTCNARMKELQCVLLPQVVAAQEGDTDPIMLDEFDAGQPVIKFDPCGHTIALENFVQSVQHALNEGQAQFDIRRTSLGHYCLTCPVRGETCAGSFVHDFRHYKLAGRVQYQAMKAIALNRVAPEDPTGPRAEDEATDPVTAAIRRIQATITDASMMKCPGCNTSVLKDSACTHMETCRCGVERWCYFCGQRSPGRHNTDYRQNPSRCPMYLHYVPFLSQHAWQALQRFHRWRGIRMLHELRENLGRQVFDEALARAPALLEDLFEQRDDRALHVAGTSITLEEIVTYPQQAVWDEANNTWRARERELGYAGRMP